MQEEESRLKVSRIFQNMNIYLQFPSPFPNPETCYFRVVLSQFKELR